MFCMLSTDVAHAKIIHDECEGDRSADVLPQARCGFAFIIAVWRQSLSQEFIAKDASLR